MNPNRPGFLHAVQTMSDRYTEQPDRDRQADGLSPVMGKWGDAIHAGFQLVPDVLLKNQRHLGMSATETVVLLNLTMHWWYPTRHPYPRPATIARRMGVSVRTVQRALGRLSELGLVERLKVESSVAGGPVSTAFRLTCLVHQLEPLARDDVAYRPHGAALAFGQTPDRKTGGTA